MIEFDETIEKVYNYAQNQYDDDDIHGFPHILRVYNLCMKMARDFDIDYTILKIATLLHDIGRKDEGNGINLRNHANLSAELAKDYIIKNNIDIKGKELEQVLHCIKAHSFSNGIEPLTIEAKILSDADKLDALGAIGLYRTIGFTIKSGGFLQEVITHLETKILKLKDKLFLKISKKIAKERESIIQDFYNEVRAEM